MKLDETVGRHRQSNHSVIGERDDAVVVGREGGVAELGSKPSFPLWA